MRCTVGAIELIFLDAVWSKDLRAEVLPLFNSAIRSLTSQVVLEETGGSGVTR